jgi:hypothetical protein
VETTDVNLFGGWIAMLCGVVSGTIIGLFFHQEEWMGGYSSFRRRMTRLGHISFWGLGFVNILFTFSVKALDFNPLNVRVSSAGLLLGLITMPLCCFLTAWQKSFRYLFPIPVVCVLIGVVSLLLGWPSK